MAPIFELDELQRAASLLVVRLMLDLCTELAKVAPGAYDDPDAAHFTRLARLFRARLSIELDDITRAALKRQVDDAAKSNPSTLTRRAS